VARTETLAEAQAGGVEWLQKCVELSACIGSDMPDTRAVEVHLHTMLMREARDGDNLVLGEDGAVECVLNFNYLRRGTIRKSQ
jgi:hypothetical protein